MRIIFGLIIFLTLSGNVMAEMAPLLSEAGDIDPVKSMSNAEALAVLEKETPPICLKEAIIINGEKHRSEEEVLCIARSFLTKRITSILYAGKADGTIVVDLLVPPSGKGATVRIISNSIPSKEFSDALIHNLTSAAWPDHDVKPYNNKNFTMSFLGPKNGHNKSFKADAVPARP